jgi:uncharacterized protein YutE (UPF0331/DUF86 family)
MNRRVIDEKLESLRRCVARIEEKRAASAAALHHDLDRQDILSVNLSRAVQICVDIAAHVLARADQAAPQTMGEAFDLLQQQGIISEDVRRRLRAAVGFRNISVHSYTRVDWDIVHAISLHSVDDFREFAGEIAAWLESS